MGIHVKSYFRIVSIFPMEALLSPSHVCVRSLDVNSPWSSEFYNNRSFPQFSWILGWSRGGKWLSGERLHIIDLILLISIILDAITRYDGRSIINLGALNRHIVLKSLRRHQQRVFTQSENLLAMSIIDSQPNHRVVAFWIVSLSRYNRSWRFTMDDRRSWHCAQVCCYKCAFWWCEVASYLGKNI